MSLLDNLTVDDLDEEQRELAECIGIEAYKKLVRNYAGSPVRVRMPKTITKPLRDDEIRDKFNGSNYRELAREYDLSESSIRQIVRPKLPQLRAAPFEGQTSLFDENK